MSQPPQAASLLVCGGCGRSHDPGAQHPFRCAAAGTDDADHVMVHRLADGACIDHGDDANPFVRHREGLWAWHAARARGQDDASFIARVRRLDDAIAAVDGRGFQPTPYFSASALGAQLGVELWIKDDTGNVAGSHKARHLMGILLHLDVVDGDSADRAPLAIASCGNAALAAAVLARAARRALQVFVPPDAEPAVLQRLHELGAQVVSCARAPGETGDPCVHRFAEAVAAGALPFCCQGDWNALTIDGGQTLVQEMLDSEAPPLDHLVIQVGGGALASACLQALMQAQARGRIARLPRVHTVQTHGAWPLRRAWMRLRDHATEAGLEATLQYAATHRSAYMWPWERPPHSVAHGILDDETYDWLAVLRGMARSGGQTVLADEDTLVRAQTLVRDLAGVNASATGSAGLAGMMQLHRDGVIRAGERVGVLVTGVQR